MVSPMRTTLNTDFFASPRPRVIAHRGFSGEYPENTIPAFQAADEIGAAHLELDVHLTRDGEVVVIHDDDLLRVAGVDGVIARMDLSAVLAADAGHHFSVDGVSFPFRGKGIRVPTLREVLGTFPAQRFIIEIKQSTPSLVRPTLDIIEQCAMSRRVLIASEHQAPLDEVRVLAPSLPTNFSSHEVGLFMLSLAPGAAPYVPPGDALEIPPEHQSWQLVTPASVATAHRSGVEVHVWTVNEVAEMRELLALGVDGVITNYPPRLLDVVSTA
ncbi:MAG TPA: glycerophosphodiester phosphodiesterase [Candidatus Binataceae bacterium]|nr:glycerophosphodiester phosphodiesterase [Candidatus Binataceae bacterium]